MKEFMIKHPFWTYCIINCICITVENIVNGNGNRTKALDDTIDIVKNGITEVSDKIRKSSKEPMGFHFNKEEA